MNITGKNLEIVRHATELALMEVHNQIGTCPDARDPRTGDSEMPWVDETRAALEYCAAATAK